MKAIKQVISGINKTARSKRDIIETSIVNHIILQRLIEFCV